MSRKRFTIETDDDHISEIDKGGVEHSDDEPSDSLGVEVKNSDDGATQNTRSIKNPTNAPRGGKNDDDGTAAPITRLCKSAKTHDDGPSRPLTPLCREWPG